MAMSEQDQRKKVALAETEDLIRKAIKKIGGRKESDLCKFLPGSIALAEDEEAKGPDGYIHHFSLRKMKNEQPEKLREVLQHFILKPEKPARVPPKPRRPRGSRKRHEVVTLNPDEMERLVGHVRLAGDQEMILKLSPKKSLGAAKRSLMASVRKNRVEPELWAAFVEAVNAHRDPSEPASPVPAGGRRTVLQALPR